MLDESKGLLTGFSNPLWVPIWFPEMYPSFGFPWQGYQVEIGLPVIQQFVDRTGNGCLSRYLERRCYTRGRITLFLLCFGFLFSAGQP
jgi:hypothetical protein